MGTPRVENNCPDKDICRSNDPFVLAIIDLTGHLTKPIIKIAHFVADYHFHSQGTDTKDSDGDTSYVEPESFLDDWDKWIED